MVSFTYYGKKKGILKGYSQKKRPCVKKPKEIWEGMIKGPVFRGGGDGREGGPVMGEETDPGT